MVSPYTWSASASPASLQTDYMYVSGSSSYYSNPATFNMTAGNTNITTLDNYSRLVIRAKSGSSSYTGHYVAVYLTFSNGEYVYLGNYITIDTNESVVSVCIVTPEMKTQFKNLYESYGTPTIKFQIYKTSRSSSPKYQCREVYVYQLYFEPMPVKNAGLITKTTRSQHCSMSKDRTCLTVHSTYSGKSALARVYGNFSGKSYSFKLSSSDAADDKVIWLYIYYKKNSTDTYYTTKTLTFTSDTYTGTFPSNTEYFVVEAGGDEDYTRDAHIYSVIIDGVEYFDYLYWYASWPQA